MPRAIKLKAPATVKSTQLGGTKILPAGTDVIWTVRKASLLGILFWRHVIQYRESKGSPLYESSRCVPITAEPTVVIKTNQFDDLGGQIGFLAGVEGDDATVVLPNQTVQVNIKRLEVIS